MNIRICPKCKSKNIGLIAMPAMAIGFPPRYKCEDCGYEGYVVLEIYKKESKKTKKSSKKKKQ